LGNETGETGANLWVTGASKREPTTQSIIKIPIPGINACHPPASVILPPSSSTLSESRHLCTEGPPILGMSASVSARALETVAAPMPCLCLSYVLLCSLASGWVRNRRIGADSSAWIPSAASSDSPSSRECMERDILTQYEAPISFNMLLLS